jgi:hypothetical protein
VRDGGTDPAEDCGQVQVHDEVPLFIGEFVNLLAYASTGVVEEDIQVTKSLQRRADHSITVILKGYIYLQKDCLTTVLFDEAVYPRCSTFLDVTAHDLCSFAR